VEIKALDFYFGSLDNTLLETSYAPVIRYYITLSVNHGFPNALCLEIYKSYILYFLNFHKLFLLFLLNRSLTSIGFLIISRKLPKYVTLYLDL